MSHWGVIAQNLICLPFWVHLMLLKFTIPDSLLFKEGMTKMKIIYCRHSPLNKLANCQLTIRIRQIQLRNVHVENVMWIEDNGNTG